MMTVYKVTNITDMDEVIVHKIELVVLPLRSARQQAMAAILHGALYTLNPVLSQQQVSKI